MNRKPFLIIITLLWTVLFSEYLSAKPQPFLLDHSHVHQLKSKINGIEYRLYISLPKNYTTTTQHYPVIYLLDADYSFALTKKISEHLFDRNRLKECILIGIAYAHQDQYKANRTRDYTPSFVADGGYGPEYQKNSGGAEKFYQFINAELLPYARKHYRIDNKATLVGHSFGGLFGIYVLLYHPQTFQNYLLVSPSLWYDNHLLLKTTQNKHDLNTQQPTNLLLFIGDKENSGEYKMLDETKQYDAIINQKPHQHLTESLKIIADSDHDTIFPTAVTHGLLAIYGTK